MRASHRYAWAAVGLAILVVLAWTQWHQDRADAPGTLLDVAPTRIDRIEIERPGQPPQQYRRSANGAWSERGHAGAVDGGRLDDMAGIAAAPVQRWLPLKGYDLHKLGLKPPQLILLLNGARLEYGVMTPFAPNRYVRVGDRIAVIPAQYVPRAPATADRRLTPKP